MHSLTAGGKYVVESHSVTYAPSATGFFLAQRRRNEGPAFFRIPFSAVGGVPYSGGELKQVALTRGYDADNLNDLPCVQR